MTDYRFLKACKSEPVDTTPVWLMRQAGRYMPEYRAVRAKVDFLTLCKSPELCTEVTLQPIDILGVDAAIVFSDILVPIEPMGMKLDFNPAPVFERPVRTQADVDKLRVIEPEADVPFVMETTKMLRRELERQGPADRVFAGAPFTLVSYMVEGGGSKNFMKLKSMMWREPKVYRSLMEKVTETVIRYLKAQVGAGAQALQLFDTWGGVLSPADYLNYVLPYTMRVIKASENARRRKGAHNKLRREQPGVDAARGAGGRRGHRRGLAHRHSRGEAAGGQTGPFRGTWTRYSCSRRHRR